MLTPHKPELKNGVLPVWFHHHGSKINVAHLYISLDGQHKQLILRGSAAELHISRVIIANVIYWQVEWTIVQSQIERIIGSVIMTYQTLAAAFGLGSSDNDTGQWLLDRFGGDAAKQGQFIRWANYLNIPGPGTGHDGDPNISIEVSEKILKAVGELLEY